MYDHTLGDIMKIRTRPIRKVNPKNKNTINLLPEVAFLTLLCILTAVPRTTGNGYDKDWKLN